MGLDIYVGAFSRYYSKDWRSPIERFAREIGGTYLRVEPTIDRPTDAVTDPEVIATCTAAWSKSVQQSLRDSGVEDVEWSDDPKAAYLAEQLTWERYSSMLLYAAYAECPDLMRPAVVQTSWSHDPAFLRVTAEGCNSRFGTLLEVETWLPCAFPFRFKGKNVPGTLQWFGAVPSLVDELQYLGAKMLDDIGAVMTEADECARDGIQIMLKMARVSLECRLPMLLDY